MMGSKDRARRGRPHEGLAMTTNYVLTDYLEAALGEAEYDKLDDGSFAGTIPPCPGAIAFSTTLRGCEEGLRSALEDWLLLGLKLGHPLPIVGGIDLNLGVTHADLESV